MKGTDITLDGATYTLKYDLNAVAVMGDKLGIKIRLAHFQEDLLNTPLPLSAIRTMLWAGLTKNHPSITEDEVGAMVDTENFGEVMSGFFEAFGLTSSDLEAEVSKKMGLEPAGRGGETETD